METFLVTFNGSLEISTGIFAGTIVGTSINDVATKIVEKFNANGLLTNIDGNTVWVCGHYNPSIPAVYSENLKGFSTSYGFVYYTIEPANDYDILKNYI